MKLRRFIYIVVIILITFEINKHITYSFEVKEKARTYSTVQIGTGAGSYSLPSTAGKPGEVLWVNDDRKVIWKDVIPKTKLAFSDPLLITQNDCDQKLGNNKFLPVNPYYEPTRGYCLATLDGSWEGIIKYQDLNGAIQDGGIIAQDLGRYCDIYYEQSYSMPPQLINQLWDAITSRLPANRYWDKFEPEEQTAIQNFVEAVRGKKLYVNYWNNYAVGLLDLIGIIIGGLRLTDADLLDLPNIPLLIYPYGWANKKNDDGTEVEGAPPPWHSYRYPFYEDYWDGRFHLESMVLFRLKPFADNRFTFEMGNFYTSVYAICVR